MPLYNAEKYVAEAIESVINQTYSNWELIIVNDGSTDNSLEIAKKFENEKIRVFSQENKGQCAANNYGFLNSNGDYVKFFDADDILSSNFIDEQIKLIGSQENILISARWGRFYTNDKSDFKITHQEVYQDLTSIDWLKLAFRNAQPMMQSALWLIPRKVVIKSGLWDERLSLINDFEFFTRAIIASEKIIHAPNAILYYRSGLQNALSGQKSRKAVESAFLSLKLGTEKLLSVENSNLTRLCCANLWQGFVYEFYYAQPDLAKKAETKIKEMGGSDLKFPCGGISKILFLFLGWKYVKLIKELNSKYAN